MKKPSVKFIFVFFVCASCCKDIFFTSKCGKNAVFTPFSAGYPPELIKLRLCQSLHLLKIGKTALF